MVPSQICEIISRALALNLWLGFLVHRADVESFLLFLDTSRLAKFICFLMKSSSNYYKFQSDKLKVLVFQLSLAVFRSELRLVANYLDI